MKSIITLLLSLLFDYSYATTYYIKTSGGSGSGLNDDNAWSFAKLNSTALASGDIVLFKKGDVFYGTLTVRTSNVSYGAYGLGDNPVITGFTQLTLWIPYSDHIYYSTLDVATLNMVTIDGAVKGMGRYPNSGYLAYTSHSGNASITGSTVGSIPFDPTGGEVVIRKLRYILDRHPITSRSANTINYSTDINYGDNNLYSPYDGNGYFIQNHLNTLDEDGEWFYDKVAKRLYIYSVTNLASRIIKASSQVQNIYLNYWTNISFNNLTFEGGNIYGAYNIGTSNISYNNCIFRQQGGNAIWASYLTNFTVKGGSITDALNNGITMEQQGSFTNIDGVALTNTGEIAGAARSGDGQQEGINITGNNTTVKNCTVLNSGYIGIGFYGNDILITHNLIDTFGDIKDDGAGIYTVNNLNTTASNRIIRGNIVLNAVGAFAGAEGYYYENYGKTAGIYLDDQSYNTLVDSNVIAHGNWCGIFLHNCGNNQVTNNLVYNHAEQLLIGDESSTITRNLTITGNTFIAKTATQQTLYLSMSVNDNPSSIGSFNNNIYARPIDDNLTFAISRNYSGGDGEKKYSLATWESTYHQDTNSQKSLVSVPDTSKIRFDYNFSSVISSIPLQGCWSDVKNINVQNTSMVEPFFGKALISISYLNKPVIVLGTN